MKRIPTLLSLAAALAVALPVATLRAHESAAEMAEAAKVLLASLSDDQKEKMVYELTDAERENWHFIPKPFEGEGMRGGLTACLCRDGQAAWPGHGGRSPCLSPAQRRL